MSEARPNGRVPVSVLWHTVRHLRVGQIVGRVSRHLPRRKPGAPRVVGVAPVKGDWVQPVTIAPLLVSRNMISIHGRELDISAPDAWTAEEAGQLWLYHLHYFDELSALDDRGRSQWRSELVDRWILENPPWRGVGWEPYPTSLRAVNWIKWHLRGNRLSAQALESLALQLSWLESQVEYHILGNHIIENAKALCFGGCFFSGTEAGRWWDSGCRLLRRELEEQILTDGGHFELSPMYHARVLENVLDLLNLQRAYRRSTGVELEELASRMLDWLSVMSHPDGRIALFGDSAFDQAADLEQLASYGERLGVGRPSNPSTPMRMLSSSGYCRVSMGRWVSFLDVAPIGPDYLPAHGHADALTFELSLDGRRIVVDTGTETYEDGARRWSQRATAAHNTVEIDGESSSQIWKSFRVGRRARVEVLEVQAHDDYCRVTAQHDGYARLRRGLLHRRTWEFEPDRLSLTDSILGEGCHEVAWRLLLHPSVSVQAVGGTNFAIIREGRQIARLAVDPALTYSIEKASYHPRFGSSVATLRLTGRATVALPVVARARLIAERA